MRVGGGGVFSGVCMRYLAGLLETKVGGFRVGVGGVAGIVF